MREREACALLHERNQVLAEAVLDAKDMAIGQPEIRLRANVVLGEIIVFDEIAAHSHEPRWEGRQVPDLAQLHAILGDGAAQRLAHRHENEIDARRAQQRHDLGGVHVLRRAAAQMVERLRAASVEQFLAEAVVLKEGAQSRAGGLRHVHMQHRLPILHIKRQGDRASKLFAPQRLGGAPKLRNRRNSDTIPS